MVTGCAVPSGIPKNYLVRPSELSRMHTGCWIINESVDSEGRNRGEISGELITVQKDTFFIQTRTSLESIPEKEIISATLYLYKNQSNNYIAATWIGVIPNIAGALIQGQPWFLAMAIPYVIVGISNAIIESSSNELRFPKRNSLDEFSKFSRFPQGLPKEVKLKDLYLRIMAN